MEMGDEFFDAESGEFDADDISEDSKLVTQGDIRGIPFETHYTGEHYLCAEVRNKVAQYSTYAFEDVTTNGAWSVVHQDGDMKVFRREVEDREGIVLDPLRATHIVRGITAREMASVFFYPETRMQWEGTLESVQLLESLDNGTSVYSHLHKRVWPSQQRETVFCSHICALEDAPKIENGLGETYFVMNFSVDHPKARINPKLIRVRINISLACQTFSGQNDLSFLKRDDVKCKMIYTAEVHPGGWAPPNVIRSIGKREITKFLKKIGNFATKYVSEKPLDI